MKTIAISVEQIILKARLKDSKTAEEIIKALPFEGTTNIWGDEIYFEIPVEIELEAGARAEVEAGELGYWPVGKAFCIFFGPTPASTDDQPKAASPVNVFGRIIDDVTKLKSVTDGSVVRVELCGEE